MYEDEYDSPIDYLAVDVVNKRGSLLSEKDWLDLFCDTFNLRYTPSEVLE